MATALPERPKSVSPVKPSVNGETKSAKFSRLARMRMTKLLPRIQLVANLGNRRQYEYTPEQANKILSALQSAVDAVKRAYSDQQTPATIFDL